MEQVRMIYSSKSYREFTELEIRDLVTKSAVINKSCGVTGFLVYKQRFFLQFLEGSSECIELLFKKIFNDPRHRIIQKLILEGSGEKIFPEWSMDYITSEDLSGRISADNKRFIVDCWSMLLPENILKE